jgi:fatty acid CoA ligase FadD32
MSPLAGSIVIQVNDGKDWRPSNGATPAETSAVNGQIHQLAAIRVTDHIDISCGLNLVPGTVSSVNSDHDKVFEPLTAALSRHARSDRPAFTFIDYLDRRDSVEHTISWAELDARARAVAASLARATVPGERVALTCPQNLDFVVGFLGALYAGTVAVPLSAPEPNSPGDRLVGVLTDCEPQVWLTSSSTLPATRELLAGQLVPRPKQVIAVDTVPGELAADFTDVTITADQPAYLQYTSGSTSQPAGAVITHGATVANVHQAMDAYPLDMSYTSVGWLPFFHDMGLVQQVCIPVVVGCRSVFMTPFAFVRRPTRWLTMLGAYPDTYTAAPNFAYELAASRLSTQDVTGLDLSGVRVAVNGAEPIRARTIDRFLAATRPLRFRPEALRPSYGLAEATVLVTTTRAGRAPTIVTLDRERLGAGTAVPVQEGDALRIVSSGEPAGQELRIVDPEHHIECEDDRVGEIWLRGPNIAAGYWRQPERSAPAFDGRLAGGPPSTGWLRTGDLGVLHDGELFVTGRLKDMIIIDGRNHYPQDIEATVEDAHPAVRRGHVAVFTVDDGDREELVAVAEHRQQMPPEDRDHGEVGNAVRAAVSRHHDLRLADFVLLPPGGVLRTSSGKIARSANRDKYLGSS